MIEKLVISPYLLSWEKRIFDLVAGFFLLFFSLPIIGIVFILVFISEGWPVFFVQNRVGKDGNVFRMYKFRTMRVGADKEQAKYRKLNEADGPVFKIRNDPRFVGVGKWLSHVGFDELPQIFNVLKGEMSLVGPRPLPVYEANFVDEKYKTREMVFPGIMSFWVVNGSHKMSFVEWAKLDREYIVNATMISDIGILFRGCSEAVGRMLFCGLR